MTEYLVPYASAESEFEEKRSRFISHVFLVESYEKARARIDALKKKYYDARHNCWCLVLHDGTVRYGDDGEPQGTAGQPMLNVFQREGCLLYTSAARAVCRRMNLPKNSAFRVRPFPNGRAARRSRSFQSSSSLSLIHICLCARHARAHLVGRKAPALDDADGL